MDEDEASAVSRERIDPGDFHALYVRLQPHLEAQARRFLKRPQEIEDVVQETLLRLFQADVDLQSDLQTLAFARRVLTNLCIDRFRAAGRRPTVISLETSLAHQVANEEEGPDLVLRAEDAVVVREAFAMLSPQHRTALIMREIEERPLPAIAAELDVPVESVKHVLFRARRSLRRLLAGTQVEPGVDPEQAERVRGGGPESGFPAALSVLLLLVVAVAGSTLASVLGHASAAHAHTRRQATVAAIRLS
jgi:RNA polymerase sigma-70 factor, ECF subfamily